MARTIWRNGVANRGTKERPAWYVRYREGGKQKMVHSHQTSYADAVKYLAEVKARMARGLIGVPESTPVDQAAAALTMRELSDKFVKEYSRPTLKNLIKYRQNVGCLVRRGIWEFRIADLAASKLRPADVALWRDELTAAGYAMSSVNRLLSLLHAIFAWGLEYGFIPAGANPCTAERMPAKPSEEHYTLDQVQRILARPDCPPVVAAALYTGCRKGELLGLTWGCVKLEGDIPVIEVQTSYATGSTKTGQARTVPVHPELLPILRAWRERCPTGSAPDAVVFPVPVPGGGWRMGAPGCLAPIRSMLTKEKIPIPARPWHACRHSLATHMLEASGNEHAVSLMLGHMTMGVRTTGARTTRGYTHASVAYIYRELCRMTLLPAIQGVTSLQNRKRQQAAG